MNVGVYNKNINKAIVELKRKLSKDGLFSALRDRRDGVNKSGRERIKEGRAKTRLKKMLKTQERNNLM